MGKPKPKESTEPATAEKKTRGSGCPKCGSTLTYIRIKANEIVCRSCGKVTPLEEEK